jgi:CYTH domain-containing protein
MIETERKLIIMTPDEEILRKEKSFTKSEITQIYLEDPIATHRVRKRIYEDGRAELTENKKVRISKMSSIEDEREITEGEFLSLAEKIEEGAHPLRKTRRTFEYLGRVVEIDSYSEWISTSVLEVELESEEEELRLPEYIRVIADVTGVKKYSNHSMAHNFPEELI